MPGGIQCGNGELLLRHFSSPIVKLLKHSPMFCVGDQPSVRSCRQDSNTGQQQSVGDTWMDANSCLKNVEKFKKKSNEFTWDLVSNEKRNIEPSSWPDKKDLRLGLNFREISNKSKLLCPLLCQCANRTLRLVKCRALVGAGWCLSHFAVQQAHNQFALAGPNQCHHGGGLGEFVANHFLFVPSRKMFFIFYSN